MKGLQLNVMETSKSARKSSIFAIEKQFKNREPSQPVSVTRALSIIKFLFILIFLEIKGKIANSGQLGGIFTKSFSFSHFSQSKCCSLKLLSGKRNVVLRSVHLGMWIYIRAWPSCVPLPAHLFNWQCQCGCGHG